MFSGSVFLVYQINTWKYFFGNFSRLVVKTLVHHPRICITWIVWYYYYLNLFIMVPLDRRLCHSSWYSMVLTNSAEVSWFQGVVPNLLTKVYGHTLGYIQDILSFSYWKQSCEHRYLSDDINSEQICCSLCMWVTKKKWKKKKEQVDVQNSTVAASYCVQHQLSWSSATSVSAHVMYHPVLL